MIAYKPLKMKFVGIRPLILSNPYRDPKSPIVAELKEFSAKRKKTEADAERIAYLQFLLSLYLNDNDEIIIPALNIYYCLFEGAKNKKKGKDVKIAISVDKSPVIQYDGPKNIDEMFKDGFRFTHGQVTLMGGRTEVTQCRFNKWELNVEILYDENILNLSDMQSAAEFAGRAKGLGTWRPLHGLFTVEF